jgi:uncharacterized protein (TIGR02231 family)
VSETVIIPITSVTVLEDRAQITRQASLTRQAGLAQLRLDAVSPLLADRTVVARIESGSAEVLDARIERRHRDRDERERDGCEASLVALERELEVGELDEIALEAERARHNDRLDDLERLSVETLNEAADDAAWGREAGPLESRLVTLREAAGEALDAMLALAEQRDRKRRQLARLRRRIQEEARRPSVAVSASLELDVAIHEAGSITLRIDYVVPAAAWRPHHRARLIEGRLSLETDGCIWQNTGEDWQDVALSLSTERLSLGTEPPALTSDELRVQRRQAVIAVETRDQRIEEASLERAPASELPGIDDGGEPLVLRPAERVSVPSDGRPHRVHVGTLEAEPELVLVGRPELDPNVHLLARLTNDGPRPLLAGPVDVIREGGMSGRSKLLYVGPGERFELGLGPEPDLRLRRDTELKADEARLLSSWSRTHHPMTVRISNLGREPRRIRLRERIPVSELEKVKVGFRRATGGSEPDSDGFVDFERQLTPRGTDRIEVSYHVDKHDDVVGL